MMVTPWLSTIMHFSVSREKGRLKHQSRAFLPLLENLVLRLSEKASQAAVDGVKTAPLCSRHQHRRPSGVGVRTQGGKQSVHSGEQQGFRTRGPPTFHQRESVYLGQEVGFVSGHKAVLQEQGPGKKEQGPARRAHSGDL
jgi:hypothetical protein